MKKRYEVKQIKSDIRKIVYFSNLSEAQKYYDECNVGEVYLYDRKNKKVIGFKLPYIPTWF